MDAIQNEKCLPPVTALAFCQLDRLYLLAGQGQYLKIFNYDMTEVLLTERIFAAETIHGIATRTVSREDIRVIAVVWGGNSVSVIYLKGRQDDDGKSPVEVQVSVPEIRLDDWILDSCFKDPELGFETPASEDALLVTAHNEIYKLCFKSNSFPPSRVEHALCQIASGSRSILYSAHVIWPLDDRILIAAGTVFGEVLLWSFDVSAPTSHTSIVLHHTFVGHEGSVFGVRIFEPAKDGKRLLASCSDDRTIRVWDVHVGETFKAETNSEVADPSINDHQVGLMQSERRNKPNDCLAMVMGHASRIWGVRFLSHFEDYREILSHGEDGTVQIWRLQPENRSSGAVPAEPKRSFELKHHTTFAYHSGKNIWAVAVHCSSSDSHIIASGGADGKIATLRPISHDESQIDDAWDCHYTMEKVCAATNLAVKRNSNESSNHAPTPLKELFDSLKGRWKLSRKIESRLPTYPSGTFEGVASFEQRSPSDEAYIAEYLYSEIGDFAADNGLTMKAMRRYVYRYDENSDAISVWFVKTSDGSTVDYFFHRLDFSVSKENDLLSARTSSKTRTAKAHHQCNADGYSPEYNFETENSKALQWSLGFLVQGPSKDYTTMALYTPDHAVVHAEVEAPKELDSRAPVKSGEVKTVTAAFDLKKSLDGFKTYSWVSGYTCLASTQAGKILIDIVNTKPDFDRESAISWEPVGEEPKLQSSCIATSLSSTGTVFLTGMDGSVFLYEHSRKSIRSVYSLPRKAGFLKAQSLSNDWNEVLPSSTRLQITVGVLATCLGSLEATALFFVTNSSNSFSLLEILHLDLPPAFIVTSSCFTSQGKLIIAGSRSGGVAIYNLSSLSQTSNSITTPHIFHQVHGQEAVTVIQAISTETQSTNGNHILTAGRDGSFAIHRISRTVIEDSYQARLQTLHQGVPPFGPNIEGACIDSGDLYLWGFRSTEFVVWNETQKIEIMTVDCGGAHRSWAYHHHRDGNGGGKFVYTKASVCHLHVQSKASHRVFQQGGHGREIKAMALSPPVNDYQGQQLRVLATGAEDTAIRLFDIDSRDRGYKCLSVLTKHTTGLRKLEWSPDGRYLFSAAGCEEFFVWRVRPAPLITIGIVCEAKCPSVTDERDLRIMNFAVNAVDFTPAQNGDLEDECTYLLSMVYSDSSVRIFQYQTRAKSFTLLSIGTYTTYCLTQAANFHYEGSLYLCTGSTDGHLTFWPLPSLLNVPHDSYDQQKHITPSSVSPSSSSPTLFTTTHRLCLHQNSIKALVVIPLTPTATLIITGGDDGAIALTILHLSHLAPSSNTPLEPKNTLHVPKAHASAVTALAYLGAYTPPANTNTITRARITDDGSNGEKTQYHRIASTSNDQRLKTWNVSIDLSKASTSGIKIRKEGNVHSAVADASSLVVDMGEGNYAEEGRDRSRLYIAGVGTECWRV